MNDLEQIIEINEEHNKTINIPDKLFDGKDFEGNLLKCTHCGDFNPITIHECFHIKNPSDSWDNLKAKIAICSNGHVFCAWNKKY